jgi:hypothetical protein
MPLSSSIDLSPLKAGHSLALGIANGIRSIIQVALITATVITGILFPSKAYSSLLAKQPQKNQEPTSPKSTSAQDSSEEIVKLKAEIEEISKILQCTDPKELSEKPPQSSIAKPVANYALSYLELSLVINTPKENLPTLKVSGTLSQEALDKFNSLYQKIKSLEEGHLQLTPTAPRKGSLSASNQDYLKKIEEFAKEQD